MIRLEICLLVVIGFISFLYISSKGNKGRLHHIFSWILVMMIFHLIFDAITVYTVHHLDLVPKLWNDIFHRIFIGSMIFVVYLFYCFTLSPYFSLGIIWDSLMAGAIICIAALFTIKIHL